MSLFRVASAAVIVAVLGCEATTAPPPASDAPVRDAVPEPETPRLDAGVRPPPTTAQQPTALTPPTASLCVRMCERQGQARAVGPGVITRECESRCETPPEPPTRCDNFAEDARTRVEAVGMNKRAEKIWAELARPDFYCGYSDPLTRGLSAAATEDRPTRRTALERALAADPWGDATCGNPVDLAGSAEDAIAACDIDEPSAGWHADVDAASYLAMRAVRVRLEALGLYGGDRKILLQTLTLSTALASEK